MDDDHRETIRRLAALADIPLSEDRIAALVTTLPFVQAQIARLADLDYGEAEPAGRFRPQREEQR
jgi:Asp-tRNA(Asn)/Glu-tRNA(Gln) amidotransferase C subunit